MKSVRIDTGSAITLLNAIYADFGAAVGIDIPIYVEIKETNGLSINTIPQNPPDLINTCLEIITEETGLTISDMEISTYSPLPAERGLKTSSAISCALINALSDYYDLELNNQQIIQLAAKASIRTGVSITGAYDDAYASFTGGLVITENQTSLPVHHVDIGLTDEICLLIPNISTPKNSIDVSQYYMPEQLQREIVKNILDEYIDNAIRINTDFYAPKLLTNPEIISELSDLPCRLVGLNGAGPSLFAFCSYNEINSFIRSTKESFPEYHVMKTSLKRMYRKY
ncbi:MAG: shikimate kinase [Candidatus Kariarchaeaceae archaeon]|jgi:shikimate kinase